AHREKAEDGCPLVALISEVARADGPVKGNFEAMVRELRDKLEAQIQVGEPGPADERALAALAMCVGGLGLARAVRDEVLAERLLESCRNQAGQLLRGVANSPGVTKPRREENN